VRFGDARRSPNPDPKGVVTRAGRTPDKAPTRRIPGVGSPIDKIECELVPRFVLSLTATSHLNMRGRRPPALSIDGGGSTPTALPWRHGGVHRSSRSASSERVDGVRDREAQRRDDPDQLASVLVRLGHHRVREHSEDRTCSEREDEADGVG
jgi:hypothetical protein